MQSSIFPRPAGPELLEEPLSLPGVPVDHPQTVPMLVEYHRQAQARQVRPAVWLTESAGNDEQGIFIASVEMGACEEVVVLPVTAFAFLPELINSLAFLFWGAPEAVKLQLAVLMWILFDFVCQIVLSHVHFPYFDTGEVQFLNVASLDILYIPRRVDTRCDGMILRTFPPKNGFIAFLEL